MLSLKKFTLILSVLILMLTSANVFAKRKSYTMVCQGGGNMSILFRNNPKAFFYIYFEKSSSAGTSRAPRAGECAWMDRPISNKEPVALTFFGPNPIRRMRIYKGGGKNTIEPYLSGQAKSGGILVNAVIKGKKFFVQARRKGRVFQITKVGL